MKRYAVVLVCVLALLAPSVILAGNGDGWSLDLALVNMGVKGYGGHIGDLYTYNDRVIGDSSGYQDQYVISYKPLDVTPGSKMTPYATLSYRKGADTFGVSFWNYSGEQSLGGSVASSVEGYSNGATFVINGVRFLDHTLFPLTKQDEPSGLSPVAYSANSKLSISNATLFWKRDFHGFSGLAGIKWASLEDRIGNQLEMDSFIFDYFNGNPPGYDWVNHVTIGMKSSMKASLAGPYVGISWSHSGKRFSLGVTAAQSIVFGSANYTGFWHDEDKAKIVQHYSDETIQNIYLDGPFPYNYSESVAVPVSELRIDASYRLGRHLSLGVGAFYSAWFNAPQAPRWSVPGGWTLDAGSGWQNGRATLVFGGGLASVGFRF